MYTRKIQTENNRSCLINNNGRYTVVPTPKGRLFEKKKRTANKKIKERGFKNQKTVSILSKDAFSYNKYQKKEEISPHFYYECGQGKTFDEQKNDAIVCKDNLTQLHLTTLTH